MDLQASLHENHLLVPVSLVWKSDSVKEPAIDTQPEQSINKWHLEALTDTINTLTLISEKWK